MLAASTYATAQLLFFLHLKEKKKILGHYLLLFLQE